MFCQGGEAAVYEASEGAGANGRVLAVSIESGEVTELTSGRFPRYSQGYLLFTDQGGTTLLAQPFDPENLELSGAATPIAEGLRSPSQGWMYLLRITDRLSCLFHVGLSFYRFRPNLARSRRLGAAVGFGAHRIV